MYAATGNSAPAAPPALPVTPSNNLLLNGDFETGSLQPWRETGGDNPYGLTGNTYSAEGAYDFVSYAPSSGIACPSNNYCYTFGAALAPLPIQTTVAVPSGTSANYSLTWTWYSPGTYNSSDPNDVGSQFLVGAVGNTNNNQATSGAILWAVYNTSVSNVASPATVTVNIGVPPSGTTSLTIQMQGFFYAVGGWYTLDNIQLTTTGGVTASQSAPVYSCGQATNSLTLTQGGSVAPGSNAAAQFTAGLLTVVAALVSAVSMLML